MIELIFRTLESQSVKFIRYHSKKRLKASATTIIYSPRTLARKTPTLDPRKKKTRPDVLSSSTLKRMKYRNSLGLIVQIQFRTFLQIKESPHRKRGFGGGKLRYGAVLHEWFFMFVLIVTNGGILSLKIFKKYGFQCTDQSSTTCCTSWKLEAFWKERDGFNHEANRSI